MGQGRLFAAARAEAKLVRFRPVRSMKRENAENQRARIASALDRHGIGWSGCRVGRQHPVASGAMVRSDMSKGRSSMAGFVCLPCGNVVALGVRCVLGATGSDECLFGVWFVRLVAFGDAGGCVAELAWRLITIVIPGEAERSPGIHAPLKETGFPPSRE